MTLPRNLQLVAVAFSVISTYLSAQLCFFVMDQYTYYKYLNSVGLPYGQHSNHSNCFNGSSPSDKHDNGTDWAQSQTAHLNSLASFLAIGIGILTNLLIGHLSDRVGRKPALLVVLSGLAFEILLSAIIVTNELNPWWRILPSLVEGMLGGGLLSSTAQFSALMVDLEQQIPSHSVSQPIQPEGRLNRYWLRLAYLDGFIALCLSGGTALGGALVYRLGFSTTALVNLVLFVPTIVFFWFLPFRRALHVTQIPNNAVHSPGQLSGGEPDFITKAERNPLFRIFSISQRCVVTILKFLSTDHQLSNLAIGILFPIALAYMLEHSFLFLYLMGSPFCWNSETVGLWNGLMGAAATFLSVLVISLMYSCNTGRLTFRSSVRYTVSPVSQLMPSKSSNRSVGQHKQLFVILRLGLFFLLVSRLVLGLAYLFSQPGADGLVYLSMIIRLPKNFIFPAIRTIVASACREGSQGRVFAVLGFWERLGMLVSMSVLPVVYTATMVTFKATAFVICTSLLATALLLTIPLDMILQYTTVDGDRNVVTSTITTRETWFTVPDIMDSRDELS